MKDHRVKVADLTGNGFTGVCECGEPVDYLGPIRRGGFWRHTPDEGQTHG